MKSATNYASICKKNVKKFTQFSIVWNEAMFWFVVENAYLKWARQKWIEKMCIFLLWYYCQASTTTPSVTFAAPWIDESVHVAIFLEHQANITTKLFPFSLMIKQRYRKHSSPKVLTERKEEIDFIYYWILKSLKVNSRH